MSKTLASRLASSPRLSRKALDNMAGLAASLVNLLTPDVTIVVSPSLFVFRCRDREARLPPVLWLSGEGQRLRVLGVGDAPLLTEPYRRIDLFNVGWDKKLTRDHEELIEAFCRYGIYKTLRRTFARPKTIVRGIDSFPGPEILAIRATLSRALVAAGVHEVVLDDEE